MFKCVIISGIMAIILLCLSNTIYGLSNINDILTDMRCYNGSIDDPITFNNPLLNTMEDLSILRQLFTTGGNVTCRLVKGTNHSIAMNITAIRWCFNHTNPQNVIETTRCADLLTHQDTRVDHIFNNNGVANAFNPDRNLACFAFCVGNCGIGISILSCNSKCDAQCISPLPPLTVAYSFSSTDPLAAISCNSIALMGMTIPDIFFDAPFGTVIGELLLDLATGVLLEWDGDTWEILNPHPDVPFNYVDTNNTTEIGCNVSYRVIAVGEFVEPVQELNPQCICGNNTETGSLVPPSSNYTIVDFQIAVPPTQETACTTLAVVTGFFADLCIVSLFSPLPHFGDLCFETGGFLGINTLYKFTILGWIAESEQPATPYYFDVVNTEITYIITTQESTESTEFALFKGHKCTVPIGASSKKKNDFMDDPFIVEGLFEVDTETAYLNIATQERLIWNNASECENACINEIGILGTVPCKGVCAAFAVDAEICVPPNNTVCQTIQTYCEGICHCSGQRKVYGVEVHKICLPLFDKSSLLCKYCPLTIASMSANIVQIAAAVVPAPTTPPPVTVQIPPVQQPMFTTLQIFILVAIVIIAIVLIVGIIMYFVVTRSNNGENIRRYS